MTLMNQPIASQVFELAAGIRAATSRRSGRLLHVEPDGAFSIHVYGTDLSRIGSSALRYYDLPVKP